MNQSALIAVYTLIQKESGRIFRAWAQTLLPPVMTTTLYFLIFGQLIGQRLGLMHGVTYSQYIAPGLIMLAVITNTYTHVSSSVYLARFARHIEEVLVSPLSNMQIITGFVCSGMLRGILSGFLVTLVALLFTHLTVSHIGILITVSLLTTLLFALAGFVNGLYANDFDGIAIIPTFVLTPLTYLGGVFYSINMLPELWQKISHFNPILYIVNVFRYGMLDMSDVAITQALILLGLLNVAMLLTCLYCMNHSTKLRQ